MIRLWKGVGVVMVMCGLTAYAEDKEEKEAARVVKLPLTGLKAGCCDSAVGKAIGALAGVDGVSFEEDKAGKWAVIRLKKDAGIELSKVQDALAQATKGMGKAMGTEYKLDVSAVYVDASVEFRTSLISDDAKARLDKSLADLKGYESSTATASDKNSATLMLKFKDATAGTLGQVTKILKDAKVELKEVVFRGIAAGEEHGAGGGFTCPMCSGSFFETGKCPKCGIALVTKGKDDEKKEKGGGCCGGD